MRFQRSRESHLILPVYPKLKGFFKLTAIRPDGRERPLTDWFPNLITDGGLNRMGTGDWIRWCHVGSGSNAPTATDTSLQTFVASTQTHQSNADGAQSSEPYYSWRRITYRFGTGAAAGNLSEVGVSWVSDGGGPIYSRALILDGAGSPTTITVLADEVLDVAYELRLYPPTVDQSYNVVDDGPDGTIHAVVLRAGNVTQSTSVSGWQIDTFGGLVDMVTSSPWRPIAYNGSLGSITQLPSGTATSSSSVANEAYSNNSLERFASSHWGLNAGNLTGGISAVRFSFRNTGTYQASFDPVIPKDETKVLTLGFKVNWSRAA